MKAEAAKAALQFLSRVNLNWNEKMAAAQVEQELMADAGLVQSQKAPAPLGLSPTMAPDEPDVPDEGSGE